jgi:hypothetical protein
MADAVSRGGWPSRSAAAALLAAAKGHVIAKGELSGTYQQQVRPPKSGVPPAELARR